MDGTELLAKWRETGEWWSGESQREFTRYVAPNGFRSETNIELPSLTHRKLSVQEQKELLAPDTNNREEWNLRIHKRRDEKVAQACGYLPREVDVISSSQVPKTYAALQVQSGYSFGRGTMLAEEIPILCAGVGISAACLADRFSLIGAVEFVRRSKAVGIKPLIGCTVEMEDGSELVLITKSKHGYESLSHLLTKCYLEEPRQFPLCNWHRLEQHSRDLICLSGGHRSAVNRLLIQGRTREAGIEIDKLSAIFGRSNLAIQIDRGYLPWEVSVNRKLESLADSIGVLLVAGGKVTHARPEHFPVQDVLVCADTQCKVEEIIGRKPRRDEFQSQISNQEPLREINAERYLRTPKEFGELFEDYPALIENTLRLADRCDDDVLPNRTRLPQIYSDPGHTLREIAWVGAHERHPIITPGLKKQIDHELERIIRLNFADHFLTAWDLCNWARNNGIFFSGRGSVVDAAVSYCLGFSRIDAYKHNLHFDRFLPDDGSKRPDIDIDFESTRREDVRTYLTNKYGVDRVATVAAIGTYCTRGIVREVGKVMGLPDSLIGFLAKRMHGGVTPEKLESSLLHRPELAGSGIPKERFRWVFELAERMQDLPRNIRSHSSGVVISSEPICNTVPVMWSATEVDGIAAEPTNLRIIQWDKRSAKYFFDKFDILCLRGQDVLRGTEERIRVSQSEFRIESIPLEDDEPYRAMRSGELIGIPQSASPAMRQAHIRVRTSNLHDASLVQAGIRPGVGGAVKINELIARRRGKAFTFEHPDLEEILSLTYGILVFQEQVDQLLQKFAGYSSGEAEETRENIHKHRREDFGESAKEGILARIRENGYDETVAEAVFRYVSEFKGYGFAQGHALAFAEISVRCIASQQNYPGAYFASLLDAQPAGYYGPCTLVNEARDRGIAILPPSINKSALRFEVEDVLSAMDPKIRMPDGGIRVSLKQISGISKTTRDRIFHARSDHLFESFFNFVLRIQPNRDELERLILCGCFDDLHSNRRTLLWAIPSAMTWLASMSGNSLHLTFDEPKLDELIEDFSIQEKAMYEREILDLDIHRHLVAFERERIESKGGLSSKAIRSLPGGVKCMVVGNPIRLRFPPTPSGKRVVFFDLEDEFGLLNVTCFDAVYRRDGHAIVCSPYVTLLGETQDRDGHTAFLAKRVFPYRPTLSGHVSEPTAIPVVTGDFIFGGGKQGGLLRNAR